MKIKDLSLICGVEYSIFDNQWTMLYTVFAFSHQFKTKFLPFPTPFETKFLPFPAPFETKFLPLHTPFETKFCLYRPQKTVHGKLKNGPTTTRRRRRRRRTMLSSPWSVGCAAAKNRRCYSLPLETATKLRWAGLTVTPWSVALALLLSIASLGEYGRHWPRSRPLRDARDVCRLRPWPLRSPSSSSIRLHVHPRHRRLQPSPRRLRRRRRRSVNRRRRRSDLEAKSLDGFQPNLAWASLWPLWVTSKYFFGLTPTRGGTILEKLNKSKLSPMAQDGGRNPFAAPFAQLLEEGKEVFNFFFWGGGDLDTFFNRQSGARPVNGLASKRVRSSPQPATLVYFTSQTYLIYFHTLQNQRGPKYNRFTMCSVRFNWK